MSRLLPFADMLVWLVLAYWPLTCDLERLRWFHYEFRPFFPWVALGWAAAPFVTGFGDPPLRAALAGLVLVAWYRHRNCDDGRWNRRKRALSAKGAALIAKLKIPEVQPT